MTAFSASLVKKLAHLPPRAMGAIAFVVLGVMAAWLYGPFLNNPLVFDDSNIFYTSRLTEAAIAPWAFGIRGMPYFTLGWVETQIGDMQTHRRISLALHLLVAFQLFQFLQAILTVGHHPDERPGHAAWIACL